MAEVTVNKISTTIVENYSEADLNLIPSFDVISQFNPETDVVEFSIYNEQKLLQYINYNYIDYTITLDYNTEKNAYSSVNVNPEKDLIKEGYDQGNYTVIYNFLRNQVSSSQSTPYYIKEISSDRTEIRVANNNISNIELEELVNNFKTELNESPYFEDFEINFGNNKLFLANNILIDTSSEAQYTVLIKLYEPLETQFSLKDTLNIVLQTAEEVSYAVNFPARIIPSPSFKKLKGPNFNLNEQDVINNSTVFINQSELLSTTSSWDGSTPWTGSLGELQGVLKNKGITPNIDYSNFNNFIYFSSAEQRVRNFYYKVGQVQSYSASIAELENLSNADSSGSIAYYQTQISNILTNFDEFEQYQYYSSGSNNIYPKTNNTKPYTLALTESISTADWLYDQATISGSEYDLENVDRLYNSLPSYIQDDTRNVQYFLFIDMIGQHFDNIWVYTKDLSNRFDADNRLIYGISKDIVADAIRSMGVNLYQNNFTSDNLFASFTGLNQGGGLLPPTGSEVIETYVSASNNPTIIDDVNKEFYKRIFHNLPLLLKQKGSTAGLRNLINTFGIPDTVLRISEFGGKDKNNSNDFDYFQNTFNFAWDISGSLNAQNDGNGGEFPFSLNTLWNSADDKPESLVFRFKLNYPGGIPNEDTYVALADFNTGGTNGVLALEYTGSGFSSASYSGSIPSASNQYASLIYYDGSTRVTSVDAPFYNGDWWSLYINKDSTTYTLRTGNQIYKGDDGFKVGFYSSSTSTNGGSSWSSTSDLEIPGANVTIGSNDYVGFTGSIQEIRYYNCALNEGTFYDYIMNSDSIEGLNYSSSADNLVFRARFKETGSITESTHPKITGSAAYITQSFAADSDYRIWNSRPEFFSSHTQFIYQDQTAAGIKNRISEKVKAVDLSLPSGNTLSSQKSIQQNYYTKESGSYTKDINLLEIAFSPQNEINDDINSSMGYFNIGEYIGDPRQISESVTSYPDLDRLRDSYFNKYYNNYNWNDYIRLIKFFDNSLFKMIKDFAPAKSSLSTGVAIKQHILERNKQKPPSVETTQSYYSASIESGFTSGGTGGVFDNINMLTSSVSPQITQSWYYETQTLSGSLIVTQSTQDEFYNGELSGSEYVVTTGSLFLPNTDPLTTSSFTQDRENSSGNDLFSFPLDWANNPLGGKASIIVDVNTNKITTIGLGGAATDAGSLVVFDFRGYYDLLGIGDIITFFIPGPSPYTAPALNFTITGKRKIDNGSFNNYIFSVEHDWQPVGGWALLIEDIKNNPPWGSNNGYIPWSGLTQVYDGSPINLREIYPNPILNTVENSRLSSIYQDVDYNSNLVLPTNYNLLKNNGALKAPVQDSNYTQKAWTTSRYNGTRVSSLDYNITIER